MKLRDMFVPRWDHSDAMVRKKAVERLKNIDLLKQIAEREEHPMVRDTALEVLDRLTKEQVLVSIKGIPQKSRQPVPFSIG